MVEIDEAVIRLAKEFLPSIARDAWDDPRAEVIVGDGIAFVADAVSATYDVIIVDSTDPVGVGQVLFSDAFYADCARILRPGGLIVNQCGVPFMQADELRETSLRRAKFFAYVTAFAVAVPTYVGGLMTIGIASNSPGLQSTSEAVIKRRAENAGIDGTTNYWSPGVHVAAFQLPPYIAKHLPS
jgi:spermidine synthase